MRHTKKLAARTMLAILTLAFLTPVLSAETLVIAVRHAEREDSSKDPMLSEAGQARAEALARTLGDLEIDAIYATAFQRTRQTAEPLARAKGLEILPAPTENHAEVMAKMIREHHEDEIVVVVGHSNTTPELAAALGVENPPEIGHSTYDRLFIVRLTAEGAHLLPIRYGSYAP